jgi:hypothetical protein
MATQQVCARHNHPWGTKPALQGMTSGKGSLNRMNFKRLPAIATRHYPGPCISVCPRQALDCEHRASIGLNSQHGAGFHSLTVEMHRAAATLAGITSQMRAGQTELIAQKIGKQRSFFNVKLVLRPIDRYTNFHGN